MENYFKLDTLKIKAIFINHKEEIDGVIFSIEKYLNKNKCSIIELLNIRMDNFEDITLHELEIEQLKHMTTQEKELLEAIKKEIKRNKIRIITGKYEFIREENDLIRILLE